MERPQLLVKNLIQNIYMRKKASKRIERKIFLIGTFDLVRSWFHVKVNLYNFFLFIFV